MDDDDFDDMMDDLADDMLSEMSQEEKTSTDAPAQVLNIQPRRVPQQSAPDLSALVSQMMPMMNQFLAGQSAPVRPPQGHQKDWKDCLSVAERSEWSSVVEQDVKRQKRMKHDDPHRPLSRSYCQNAKVVERNSTSTQEPLILRNVLHSIIQTSVGHAKVQPPASWNTSIDMKAQLAARGLDRAYFDQHLKQLLAARVHTDPDYNAMQFPTIEKTLTTGS